MSGHTCPLCNENWTTWHALGCHVEMITLRDARRQRIRHEGDDPCHDCGADPERFHHLGCDAEECPACGDQLFVCDCLVRETAS